jgi:phosphohistidine phosphatase
LGKLGAKPGAILTSPLVRARQTAELAAEALQHAKKPIVLDQLKNNFNTARLLEALKPFARHKEIVLVGHRPSFPEHIAALTGSGRADALRLGKGAVACVSLDSLDLRAGTLRWLLGQKILRLL